MGLKARTEYVIVSYLAFSHDTVSRTPNCYKFSHKCEKINVAQKISKHFIAQPLIMSIPLTNRSFIMNKMVLGNLLMMSRFH